MATETKAQTAGANGNGTAAAAVRRMAASEPELAARLVIHSMPAAAATLPEDITWRLEVEGLGAWRISANGTEGPARVEPVAPAQDGDEDFAVLTDPEGLARLAAGKSPLGLMLRRSLRLRGRRRKALALRRLDSEAGPRELARMGVDVDPDLIYRALQYGIEPEWTRGERFSVGYELIGEGGGAWVVEVDDGDVRVDRIEGEIHAAGSNGVEPGPDGVVRLSMESWMRLLRGDLSPTLAMANGLTRAEGALYPITVLGRWIDRAAGLDDPELQREERQREIQASRMGMWGSSSNGAPARTVDPAQGGMAAKRDNLLTYEQLYALWEKRNWRAHELDFSVDRRQWLATPTEAQWHTAFTMSSFYVGEERVAADLAPFVLAAPNGEIETFLATQLVDETRHAVFFDRFATEVMAMSADDMRSRLREAEDELLGKPWHFLFDDSLRDVAHRLMRKPDDLELFVEGVVIYHMVTEGVLAMTGQRVLLQYTEDHSIYPGFNKGFSLVEQDEHRHIAFGVRFLRDVCEERPEMREVVVRTLTTMLPEAGKVFCPPYHDDPASFVSYDYDSSQIYGFAYNALKRRMDVIGVEIPPAEELMPGPVNPRGLDAPLAQPVDVAPPQVAAAG